MPPSDRGGKRLQCITFATVAAGLAIAVVCGLIWSDAPVAAEQQFSSGVNLVEVYASVTDPKGEPVRNLAREDFEVREAGVLQAISTFTAGDVPLSIAVAVDRSFSMSGARLETARSAGRAFLQELRPEDEAMILAVGSLVEPVAPLSRDRRAQLAAIERLDAFGTTGLHDAIIAAVAAVQPARGRRALILLSDGNDRYSQASAANALQAARQSDVMVYPVALGQSRPPLFAELSTLTGGRSFHVPDGKGLTEVVRGIARELREQYLIGYAPSRAIVAGADEWRAIAVTVKRPGVQVRARDGYLAR